MTILKSLHSKVEDLMRLRYFPWLLLLLIAILVLLYWEHSVRSQREEVEMDFDQTVKHALQLMQERFGLYENIILSTRGLYLSSERVTDDEWHNFMNSMRLLNNYPGVHSIAYARYDATNSHDYTACLDGVDPVSAASLPVEQRKFSMVVTQIDPHSLDNPLLGYDLAREAKTLMAMQGSCRQQRTMLSGVMTDPINGRNIVRLLMPTSSVAGSATGGGSNTVSGWLVLTFDVEFWLANIATALKNNDFEIAIAEVDESAFFDSRSDRARHATYQRELKFPMGSHLWQVTFYSSEDFERHRNNPFVHLVPVVALLLTLFLFTVIRWLQSSRQKAVDMSSRISEQLRESEMRYRELFEKNRAVELLIDPADGMIVDANHAAAAYYGYSREQLKQMRISDINTLTDAEVAHEMQRAKEEMNDYFLFRHRLASGEIRDVEVHSGPLDVAGKTLLYSIIHDITARVRSEQALRESEARYYTIITTAGEGYWLLDTASFRILEVNDALCQMLGYERSKLLGRRPTDFTDEENASLFCNQARRKSVEPQRSYEVVMKHRDGSDVVVRINATDMPHHDKDVRHSFAFITDITEWKKSEKQLRIAATFFETTSEAIIVTDAENRIIAINPAFTQITGYSDEDVLGNDPKILSSGRNEKIFYQEMWRSLDLHGRWQGEIWNRRKNGEIYPEWLSIVVIKGDESAERQYMAVFSDITQRKRDEEKIWHQANYDALTGLPNRNLFKDRLEQAMHAAQREHSCLALMFIDLDRFKSINDTLGHASGDLLLQEAATRLTHNVRLTDTVARLGGDEFTVLLYDINSNVEVDHIAEKLLRRLREPYTLNGREAYISGSIGITLFPGDADNLEQMLANADAAMYSAKAAGRNVYRYFTQQMNEAAQRRLMLENDLRRALQMNELMLHYQPVHDLKGKVVGAEALLRWTHPQLGPISPDEFVPLAEDIGIIVSIEQWVILQACLDTQGFQQYTKGKFFIAVNISSLQCKSEQCHILLAQALEQSGIDPASITLEITERVMMENTETVMGILREVKAMGVTLAVDDFGTGYSSLSYLKQFPIDVLKIDRAFVSGLPTDKDDVALVEAIVAMAHSLNLKVVAEGVETQEQRSFLKKLGCDQLQGFHFSKAISHEEFIAYLKAQG